MPAGIFSHTPSICRTRSRFFLPWFPCTMYTTPSILAGNAHSLRLKVKYHRLQQVWQLLMRRTPFQNTRRPVLDDPFLKRHSWRNKESWLIKQKIKHVYRWIPYKKLLLLYFTHNILCLFQFSWPSYSIFSGFDLDFSDALTFQILFSRSIWWTDQPNLSRFLKKTHTRTTF